MMTPAYQFAIGVVVVAMAYIFAQAVKPHLFSFRRSLAASLLMLAGTLTEKVLFVFEGIEYPTFDMYYNTPGHYFPSPIEIGSLVGTIALAVLFFLVVLKVIPVIELHAIEELRGEGHASTEGDD